MLVLWFRTGFGHVATESSRFLQVEKAPIVVKSGLKKEEAEELMSKLTAGERSSMLRILPYRALVPTSRVQC